MWIMGSPPDLLNYVCTPIGAYTHTHNVLHRPLQVLDYGTIEFTPNTFDLYDQQQMELDLSFMRFYQKYDVNGDELEQLKKSLS